jgi:hypothetical protein
MANNTQDVLVVVDVQDHFDGSTRVIDSCIEVVQLAMQKNMRIFLLEYKGCGETNSKIKSLLKHYHSVYVLIKHGLSGSYALQKAFTSMNLYPRNVYVCGVYTDWCVEATVRGLLRKRNDNNIHVICKACYPKEFKQYRGEKSDCIYFVSRMDRNDRILAENYLKRLFLVDNLG